MNTKINTIGWTKFYLGLIDLSGTGPKTPKQNCSCLNFTCKTNIHTFSVLSILWKKTKTFQYSIHCIIYLVCLFNYLLFFVPQMLYLEKAWTLCDSWVVYYLPFWSVFPLNKFIFEIILCALHFVARKMVCWWFVKFHNRQNKVRVKKRSSLYYLSFAAKLLRLQEGY